MSHRHKALTCGRSGLPSASSPAAEDGGGGGGLDMAAMMRGMFMMGTFCQASALGRSGSRPMVSWCFCTYSQRDSGCSALSSSCVG